MNDDRALVSARLAACGITVPEELLDGLIAGYGNVREWTAAVREQAAAIRDEPATVLALPSLHGEGK